MALAPLDRATLAYAAFASVLSVLRGREWLPLVAAHAALALVAVLAPRLRTAGGLGDFVGSFYPVLAVVGLYTTVGLVNGGAGASHDAAVQGWEEALFGGQPARDWIRARPHPALSWTLHVAYLSYYAILGGAPLVLWTSGRRPAARRLCFAMTVTFYVCYAAFLVFPVAGPRYLFPPADNAATAVWPARLSRQLLDRGAAWGTAFPSSHVAVAFVAAFGVHREWPRLGRPLVLAALLLSLGTVYGQFHYAVDALAGALVALAVLLAVRRS